jgi:hypothetical protein
MRMQVMLRFTLTSTPHISVNSLRTLFENLAPRRGSALTALDRHDSCSVSGLVTATNSDRLHDVRRLLALRGYVAPGMREAPHPRR